MTVCVDRRSQAVTGGQKRSPAVTGGHPAVTGGQHISRAYKRGGGAVVPPEVQGQPGLTKMASGRL